MRRSQRLEIECERAPERKNISLAASRTSLHGSCLRCLLRRWEARGWERAGGEKGVRAPCGIYHTASTPECEPGLGLKYSARALCDTPYGSTNRYFREARKNKHPAVAQYKACVGARQASGYSSVIMYHQCKSDTQLGRVLRCQCMMLGSGVSGRTPKQSQGLLPCQSQTHLSKSLRFMPGTVRGLGTRETVNYKEVSCASLITPASLPAHLL